MTTRWGCLRAWCAQAWRSVLQTTYAMAATQAMVGLDLTGQAPGCGPPPYPVVPGAWACNAMMAAPDGWWTVVPIGWGQCTQWADEPPAILTEAAQRAVAERLTLLTPPEYARLRVLRDRYQANHTPFTPRELAQLLFLRWLHRMGLVTG